jgi:hypothetical protein
MRKDMVCLVILLRGRVWVLVDYCVLCCKREFADAEKRKESRLPVLDGCFVARQSFGNPWRT